MANFSRNHIEKQVFNIVDLSTMSDFFKYHIDYSQYSIYLIPKDNY